MPHTAPTIRPATPADAVALARLLEAFNGPPLTSEQVAARLHAMHGLETVLLAEVQRHPVGLASVRVVPYLSEDAPYAELTELYVAPEHRRLGVGRALLQAVEHLARDRGATEVMLLTGLRNHDAQAFYRACGYRDRALAMNRPLPG